MGDALPMQILNGVHQLDEESTCRLLLEFLLSGDELKQLTLFGVLNYDAYILIGLDDFVELDYVGMASHPQNIDFP